MVRHHRHRCTDIVGVCVVNALHCEWHMSITGSTMVADPFSTNRMVFKVVKWFLVFRLVPGVSVSACAGACILYVMVSDGQW